MNDCRQSQTQLSRYDAQSVTMNNTQTSSNKSSSPSKPAAMASEDMVVIFQPSPVVGDNDDDDDDEVTCPLFMEGLPKDFASNPQLAAIASLLNDSDHEEEPPKKSILLQPQQVVGKRGGGKIRVRKHQPQATTPYQLPKRKPKTSAIGEAHLFLSMWKL